MVTFLIVWYIIGVILIWISECKRGNVRRLSPKPLIDTLYAVGVSLASIASRMGKTYGMIFKFKTHKNGKRTITRLI